MRAFAGRVLLLVAVYVYVFADFVAGADTVAAYQAKLERERA